MLKRILSIALVSASIFGLNACNSNGGFKKTEHGILYKILKENPKGAKPVVGDLVEMNMVIRYKDDKIDTTLFNSLKMNNNEPIKFPLPAPQYKGDIVEAFSLLAAGDSALLRMSVDSIKKQPGVKLPDFMKSGHFLEYTVKMISVKSQTEVKAEQEKHALSQKETDDKLLNDYFTKNNIHPTKTASGMYYIIDKPGSGPNAKHGESVTVNYTGRTLDGKVFDSNVDASMGHAKPFTFTLGIGQVIPGWDEGVELLNKGAKARLFIPSGLAYGANSPNPAAIPNDAVLTFDIEVTKIAPATEPSAPEASVK